MLKEMSQYTSNWDLSTIPEPAWNSEHGRRQRLKGPRATRVNLQPCPGCGKSLMTIERRAGCPRCGTKEPRSK